MMSQRSRRGLLGTFLALPLLLVGARAHASLVLALEMPELVGRSERVVVADVLSVTSAWDEKHERILSTIELQVGEVWKGEIKAGERLRIVQPGGAAEGIEMRVHGMPRFTPGERTVLFLRAGADGGHAVVGMAQGKRGLFFDKAEGGAGRWMVDGGDRSALVQLNKGRISPAPVPARISLDELRTQVRATVEKQGLDKTRLEGTRP